MSTGFRADVDKMQGVIDGELHRAIVHFAAISDAVQTLPDARGLHQGGSDPQNLAGAFFDSLGDAFTAYKWQHSRLVENLNQLSRDLQHVVDLYRETENGNTQHIRSVR